MNFECSHNRINDAVSKVSKLISKNSTLPVLKCIVFDAGKKSVVVKATNLNLGIEIEVPAKVKEEGMVAIPADVLVQFLSLINPNDKVFFEIEDSVLNISTGKNSTKIKTIPVDDFPDIPRVESEKEVTLNIGDFIHGLKSVYYSSATSAMKPELSSVYVYPEDNNLIFVATDSFRLAERKIISENAQNIDSVLIPYMNALELVKILDSVEGNMKIKSDKEQISFETDDIYVISRVVDGIFPDYRQIIPKESKTEAVVLRQDLQQALRISNIFSDKFNQVTMSVDPSANEISLFSQNKDTGENVNTVGGKISGESIELKFNQRYISDVLGVVLSDSIVMNFAGAGKPLIISSTQDDSFKYLVMPMNQ